MKDPRTVSPEEKERTIKLARQIFSNFVRQHFSPDEVRELQQRIAELKQPRPAPAPSPQPSREVLAQTIAATRTPEEQAELDEVLAKVRAYRGQGGQR